MTCPVCSGHDVKPSRPRWSDSPTERIQSRFPYRCYGCFTRFFAKPDGSVQTPVRPAATSRGALRSARKKWMRKALILLAVFVGMFLLFQFLYNNMNIGE